MKKIWYQKKANKFPGKIRSSIELFFGNSFDYSLIRIPNDGFLLITPFTNYKNHFIEIGIFIGNEERMLITDFGKTVSDLFGNEAVDGRKYLAYMNIEKIVEFFGIDLIGNELTLQMNISLLGKGIANILRAIQRICMQDIDSKSKPSSFKEMLSKAYRITSNQKNDHRKRFMIELEYYLKKIGAEYQKDFQINGISGDMKIVDYKLLDKPVKILNVISVRNIHVAKNKIKLNHSDLTDILQKHKRIHTGVVYNDLVTPRIWCNPMIKETLKVFKHSRISSFSFSREKDRINKFLR